MDRCNHLKRVSSQVNDFSSKTMEKMSTINLKQGEGKKIKVKVRINEIKIEKQ